MNGVFAFRGKSDVSLIFQGVRFVCQQVFNYASVGKCGFLKGETKRLHATLTGSLDGIRGGHVVDFTFVNIF